MKKVSVTGVQNLLLTKADNLSIENDGQKMSAEIQLALAYRKPRYLKVEKNLKIGQIFINY